MKALQAKPEPYKHIAKVDEEAQPAQPMTHNEWTECKQQEPNEVIQCEVLEGKEIHGLKERRMITLLTV